MIVSGGERRFEPRAHGRPAGLTGSWGVPHRGRPAAPAARPQRRRALQRRRRNWSTSARWSSPTMPGPARPRIPGNMFVPVDLLVPILDEMRTQGSSRQSRHRPWLGLSCVGTRVSCAWCASVPGGPARAARPAARRPSEPHRWRPRRRAGAVLRGAVARRQPRARGRFLEVRRGGESRSIAAGSGGPAQGAAPAVGI